MTTLIAFLVVLGILVFIHELGHFIIAKLSGVGVLKFSLGFGPKIIGIKRGETEYLISALPLGGYVKMVGEEPGEEVTPETHEKAFTSKPVAKRMGIVLAGPVMNLVLAFILSPIIFLIGIEVPAYLEKEPVVGYVPKEDAAYKAGLRKGDLVVSIDGKTIKNWEAVNTVVLSNPGKSLKFIIQRGGETKDIIIATEASSQTGAGLVGFFPSVSPTVGGIAKGFPAEKAGLEIGDTILSIDGAKIDHWAELQEAIKDKKGDAKVFVVKRGSEMITVKVKPEWNETMQGFVIGIAPQQDMVMRRYGLFGAINAGVTRIGELTILTFDVIKKLFLGEISIKTLGGPLMIAQVAGQAAESGFTAFLSLMAFLSLQLGILNLLPIPVLDGGLVVFFALEGLRGKPLSERAMTAAQNIGIGLLVLLMVFVTYNDVMRLDVIGFLRRLLQGT